MTMAQTMTPNSAKAAATIAAASRIGDHLAPWRARRRSDASSTPKNGTSTDISICTGNVTMARVRPAGGVPSVTASAARRPISAVIAASQVRLRVATARRHVPTGVPPIPIRATGSVCLSTARPTRAGVSEIREYALHAHIY